jgi:hypothetical protein
VKVIKLNRRYTQFKESGHTIGFRFDKYTEQCIAIERALREITGQGGWSRDGVWCGYFGKGPSPRPYFITLRDEAMASMVLLKISNDAILA